LGRGESAEFTLGMVKDVLSQLIEKDPDGTASHCVGLTPLRERGSQLAGGLVALVVGHEMVARPKANRIVTLEPLFDPQVANPSWMTSIRRR
jgi:hypothetical protein